MQRTGRAARWRILRLGLVVALGASVAPAGEPQVRIPRVERMPNLPRPFRVRDWRKVAVGFDRLAFDANATGQHLPLIWLIRESPAGAPVAFGLPSYVGDDRRDGRGRRLHEAITCLGAVLGASVAGVDKTRGPHSWVRLCRAYYDRTAKGLVANRVDARAGGSFWYDLFPHVLYYALADRYPREPGASEIVRRTADRWADAVRAMTGPDGRCDLNHTAFNFRSMRPVDNGRWTEPDAAAGIAWLQYAAHTRWKQPRHLAAARACLDFLARREKNPYYEVLLPFGAYTAARLNAEQGGDYDVGKLVRWCFDRSDARPDWMVVADRWDGLDCHGLAGAVNRPPHRPPGGGYAFTMNTFVMAWPLVPLVRYDPRFARAIGKWMLNAANAARLFYPDAHPPARQSCPKWTGDPGAVIAYEGLRHLWHRGERRIAAGDPLHEGWGPETDFGVYGSAYAGIFGGIVSRTDCLQVLQLDLLATDFFRGRAYPTYLYYNPHRRAVTIHVDVGPQKRDLYDCVTGRFHARGVAGQAAVTIPADGVVVLVRTPPGGKTTRKGRHVLINDVVVNYRAN